MAQTSTVAPLRDFPTPTHYTWSFPGSPIQIRIALEVVERLREQLQSSHQGLLLGRFTGQITEIDNFTPLPSAEPPSASEVTAALPCVDSSDLVGYYRGHHEGDLRLNEADIALARTLFPNPQQVFLLIQPAGTGPATATFFFWDEGTFSGDVSFLEFPLDSSLLAIAEQQRTQNLARASQTKLPVDSDLPERVDRRHFHWRKVFFGILCAALLVTAFLATMVALRVWPGNPAHNPRPPISVAAVDPPSPVDMSTPIPIGLQAERQNGDLRVTWNRASSAVRSAISGVLSVEDGTTHRKITLDSTQVRNANILYAPVTDQVQFELTLVGSEAVSESVLVILPKSGSPQVQTVTAAREVAASPVPEKSRSNPTPATDPPEEPRPSVPRRPFTLPSNPQSVAETTPALLPDAPLAQGSPTSIVTSLTPGLTNPAIAPSPVPAKPRPSAPSPSSMQPLPSEPPQPKSGTPPPAYYPPVITHSTSASYPAALHELHLSLKVVELKVSIDETGKMVKAEAVPAKVWIPQAMIQSALDAVQGWKFQPARRGNQAVPSELVLRFNFKTP